MLLVGNSRPTAEICVNSRLFMKIGLISFYILISLLLITAVCVSVRAEIYYIAPTGSDHNAGTVDAPFSTLPGGTILLSLAIPSTCGVAHINSVPVKLLHAAGLAEIQ